MSGPLGGEDTLGGADLGRTQEHLTEWVEQYKRRPFPTSETCHETPRPAARIGPRGLVLADYDTSRNGSVGHPAAVAFLGSLILAVREFRTEGRKLLDVAGRVTSGVVTVKSMKGIKLNVTSVNRTGATDRRRLPDVSGGEVATGSRTRVVLTLALGQKRGHRVGSPRSLIAALPLEPARHETGADMVRCLFERNRCRR
ncbi:hypothetical protein [Streptomyces ossamyceticus]|uniref:Uncharacterized protein n=1 Tax=Streptomyces ossamyceticus TaxID=249581 RepID=A0ABV2VBM8_9ACTN